MRAKLIIAFALLMLMYGLALSFEPAPVARFCLLCIASCLSTWLANKWRNPTNS